MQQFPSVALEGLELRLEQRLAEIEFRYRGQLERLVQQREEDASEIQEAIAIVARFDGDLQELTEWKPKAICDLHTLAEWKQEAIFNLGAHSKHLRELADWRSEQSTRLDDLRSVLGERDRKATSRLDETLARCEKNSEAACQATARLDETVALCEKNSAAAMASADCTMAAVRTIAAETAGEHFRSNIDALVKAAAEAAQSAVNGPTKSQASIKEPAEAELRHTPGEECRELLAGVQGLTGRGIHATDHAVTQSGLRGVSQDAEHRLWSLWQRVSDQAEDILGLRETCIEMVERLSRLEGAKAGSVLPAQFAEPGHLSGGLCEDWAKFTGEVAETRSALEKDLALLNAERSALRRAFGRLEAVCTDDREWRENADKQFSIIRQEIGQLCAVWAEIGHLGCRVADLHALVDHATGGAGVLDLDAAVVGEASTPMRKATAPFPGQAGGDGKGDRAAGRKALAAATSRARPRREQGNRGTS